MSEVELVLVNDTDNGTVTITSKTIKTDKTFEL